MRALNYLSAAGMILFIGFFLFMANQDIQRIISGAGFGGLERAARASVRSAREPFGVAVGAQVLDLCALPSSKSLEKHHVHELCALRNRTA